MIASAAATGDLDLPAVEFLAAQNADPLIIKGRPVPELIGFPQDQQSFIQRQVGSTCHAFTLPGSEISTIGGVNDCRVGQTPSQPLVSI